jgi:prepilin-type N-terminal cleavage/methylation domain-containing protein
MEGNKLKKPQRNQSGFSLLELIIVLIILTIIGAIAYGTFQRMAINANLETAARDIVSEFNLMRQRAMAESVDLTITFNPGANSYTVPQPGGGTLVKTLASYGADTVLNNTTLAGDTITFQRRGTTVQWGRVFLQNGRGSTATITVNSTGRANVQFNMQ